MQKYADQFTALIAAKNGEGLAELLKLKNAPQLANAVAQVNDVVRVKTT